MTRANPVRILFWLALCVPLLAFWPSSQGEAGEDWAQHVDKACTSPRYGLRIAAARKVADGGDAAVPAIRAYAAKHGKNALPSTLVDAIADAKNPGNVTLALLRDWAVDTDFYWRSSAMRGIALRGSQSLADAFALPGLFAVYLDDPAWLMRTHARFGSVQLGKTELTMLPENDPRARVRLAALVLAAGKITPPLQPLFDALADDRTFHDVPWGKRLGQEAHKALKAWLGDDGPTPEGGSAEAKDAAIEALLAAARTKSGQDLHLPVPAIDPAIAFAGGIELLSCKSGDVFVQWTQDGEVAGGLDGSTRIQLPAAAWQQLQQERTALDLGGDPGVVVCDSLRLFWTQPTTDVKVAPASLPAAAGKWLEHLARAVEEAGAASLGRDLLAGLPQFAAR